MSDLLKALNITGNLLAGLEDTTATSTTLSEGLNGTATTLDATSANSGEKLDLGGFDLPGNYSILINKLEQLALGLDSALGNFTIDRQEVEINLSGAASANDVADVADDLFDVLPAARAPTPHIAHGSRIYTGDDGQDFAHVVSDIWIGVILTLLIVFVIFFICACFVYHKFQQWKNSYRANHSDPTIEICRRCPPDYEAESLPSYTIVSGLPTYDDALEEFRKAGIILTPAVVPIIKIFESNENGKEQAVGYSLVETNVPSADSGADNISIASTTCNCGNSSPTSSLPSYSAATAAALAVAATAPPQVIELSPEHLASLSQKRLSLQISFNNSVRRQSPLRNHLLRSRAVGNTAGLGGGPSEAGPTVAAVHGSGSHGGHGAAILPALHRSTSTISLSNERQLLDQRLRHLHHRGSLY
ncbi:uncharacterized protein LOC128259897 isoform X1 [Drosophila gunungcola]|uniref:uncharacterized protein LOC128259897 isoform X1 n=1 Tax=Drosophila gunungcola TaxID=103775 RepID=UPI0022DEC419|nr:uncharacterized protein LOC128259897 isoform X1 [Drosophila gunungcola]XP_052848482.1 uncharacterized protein LOC128259897 isoform X1 [Drosophila gunungcola]XP_052848483.1 uncharacterized protein LOC128259897 isoform X1 [Drosophila gunungcola]